MDPTASLETFHERRVVVVGDVMVDEFVWGDVTRISPEAPVPILEVTEQTTMLGGAANAAANVASLGGTALLVGVVGGDSAGETARRLAGEAGMEAWGLVIDDQRSTTTKTRIVARNQQVVRIDHEIRGALTTAVRHRLETATREAMDGADACIVSDYGKGVVTPELVALVVEVAGGRPVVVDPKRRDVSAYRGVTVITPNVGELESATDRSCLATREIVDAATSLLPLLDGAAVLVTRGPGGMSLVQPGGPPIHVPARARAVFEVTGAGDTVVSALALALANGQPMASSIELASAAAAIAVSKPGTSTVTLAELMAELRTPPQ